jgi:hypothetical protein
MDDMDFVSQLHLNYLLLLLLFLLAFNLIKHGASSPHRAKRWKVAVGLWLNSRRESLYYILCSLLSIPHRRNGQYFCLFYFWRSPASGDVTHTVHVLAHVYITRSLCTRVSPLKKNFLDGQKFSSVAVIISLRLLMSPCTIVLLYTT